MITYHSKWGIYLLSLSIFPQTTVCNPYQPHSNRASKSGPFWKGFKVNKASTLFLYGGNCY